MSRKNPTLTSKIAKHTGVQVVGRIVGFGLSLISIIFLTRYLGTDGFGKYVTITVFVNAVAVFAEFGLDQIFIKEYFKTKRKKELLSNILALRAVFAIVIFAIGGLIGHFFPYAEVVKIGIWVYSLASFLVAVESIFLDIFQINLSMHRQVIAETINRIIAVLLIIFAVYFNLGLIFIILATVAGSAFQFFLAWIWANQIIEINIRFNFKFWRRLLVRSIPLGISGILVFIYYRIDTIILSLLKSSTDVGIYGASYKVLDIVNTFPGMFCGLLFPIIAAIYAQNKIPRFNKLLQKGFDVLAVTGVPTTIILMGLAKPVILLVAGNQFLPSIQVLQILSPTAMLIFLNWIFWIGLVGGDKQNILILPYSIISIFNIIINLLLIPSYSYFGAATATVVTQIVALIIAWWLTKRFFKTKISLLAFGKALIAGMFMFFVFSIIQRANLFFNWHEMENFNSFYRLSALIVIVAIGIAIYFGVLFVSGGLKRSLIRKVIQN